MTITQSFSKLSAVAFGLAVAFALIAGVFATATPARAAALTSAQVSSIISLLQSFGADAATIANVQASLTGGTPTTPPSTGGTGGACPALTRDLQVGSTGADVKALQVFLNAKATTQVSVSGAGSPGLESTYFGAATKAAVMKFQAANNVAPIAGYVGKITRAAIAAVCGGTTTNPGTPSGPGLSVSAGAQPANALAPQGATRVPFTTFTLTNNSGVVQTVTGITVERTGLGIDSNFSGIVLLDTTNNLQLGTAKTLNSNHQATIGDTFTINPGQTMTLTVAGNISSVSNVSGQIVALKVVAVNSTAAVSGVLPIMGASHTINTTLTLGSVSTTTSSIVPPTGATVTKNLGDTAVKFSGVRFTAGSAEDLKLYSVRFRQTGTASASDISNVMVNVNGTGYPTTMSADGKYYTASFAGGISIPKGNSIDVYVQGDITGSNAASRTVSFDIDRVTDVYFVGQTYGYGVAPAGTWQPWYDGDSISISAGTATTISKATEVAAQNIAPNVPNQPLGGFVTDFRGEAVSVTSLPITIATSSGASWAGAGPITQITLVNENGAVVSGPVDEATSCTTGCTVTFTDTVTFPTGRHVWTIKGKLPSGAANNAEVVVSTNPTAWSGVTGQTSGNNITLSQTNFALNTMTVKSAVLTVTLSTTPSNQNIVASGSGILFANVQLDASQSGEDVRLSSFPLRVTNATGVSGCQLWDGSVALNTGSNVLSSYSTSADNTFTFDSPLVVTKGTVKTLGLKCNLNSGTGTYVWSINSGSTVSATGVTSGVAVSVTNSGATGGTMSVAASSLALSVDSSSPSFALVAGGTTGVTVGSYKLRAANEDISLNKLALKLTSSGNTKSTGTGGTTNSGVSDLVQVYVYDGANLLGTATFTGTATAATSTFNTNVTLTKDTDKILTIKADLANIGTSQPGGIGDVVKVDPLNAQGSGLQSGTTINSAGASGNVAGVQLFKSFPTLALDTLPSTGIADGRLMRFKVTANAAGPVGINEFTFTVSTSTGMTITTLRLKAYEDSSYSTGISGQGSGGQIGSDTANITSGTAFEIEPSSNPVQIPAGGTRYFELTGAITLSGQTSYSAVTVLSGDNAQLSTGLATGYNVGTSTSAGEVGAIASNFVWSGNSTTTSAITTTDWSNGYNVPGLPSGGLIQTRSN
jgi:hypothetical protein